MSTIKAVIVDFDGTLVDTFEANFCAYRDAFYKNGLELQESFYRNCFGLKFSDFMTAAGVMDDNIRSLIREEKKKVYPSYFKFVKVNEALVLLIKKMRRSGIMTAVASTSSWDNLLNLLKYIQMDMEFDLILSGESVSQGKPSPEVYLKAFSELRVSPTQTVIFEDSPFGIDAAESSGATVVKVSKAFFE